MLSLNSSERKTLWDKDNPSGLVPSSADAPELNLKIPPVRPYSKSDYRGGNPVKSVEEFQRVQIDGSIMPLLESENPAKIAPEAVKGSESKKSAEQLPQTESHKEHH